MITAPDTLANNLRAAATIARFTHGPDCPDHLVHQRAAALLDRVADAEDTGTRLRAGERDAALRTAHTYLATETPHTPAEATGMTEMTAVSLFAGIGGFDLALERSGVNVVAAVEIDDAARGVLADQFPHTTLFTDVRKVTGDDLRAAGFVPERGILTAGFPCQDLSVAGRGDGLAGKRSGLFWEIIRLAEDLRPAWMILENVPGLLSSHQGRDFQVVLDALSDAGYLVDPNIYDAQVFGVPQRRRRVFLTCHLLDDSLRRRTTSSALMLAQCLIETSLLSLIVLSQGFAKGSPPWDSPARCVDGLQKRIKLFGMLQPTDSIYKKWLPVLAGEPARQALERSISASRHGEAATEGPTPRVATSSPGSTLQPSATCLNTEFAWKRLLDDLLPIARSCTTSTPSRTTTSSAIFTCAQALLSISEYIAALSSSSPNSWQPVSSASTAIEVLTNYARATDGDLLAEVNGLHDLVDYVAPAERAQFALGRAGGDARGPVEVLLEPEGRAGDPAARGEAGPVVAALTANGVGGGGGPDDNAAQAGHLIAGTLWSHPRPGSNSNGALIAACVTAREGKGPDSDATTTLVPVAFDTAQITSAENRSNPRPGDPAPTLSATGYPHVAHTLAGEGQDAPEDGTGRSGPAVPMAFNPQSGGDMWLGYGEKPTALSCTQGTAVQIATAVRRLTPLECERLQGFPDGWTATSSGRPQADAARYRQCGNAIAVPVGGWVVRRIAAMEAAGEHTERCGEAA